MVSTFGQDLDTKIIIFDRTMPKKNYIHKDHIFYKKDGKAHRNKFRSQATNLKFFPKTLAQHIYKNQRRRIKRLLFVP